MRYLVKFDRSVDFSEAVDGLDKKSVPDDQLDQVEVAIWSELILAEELEALWDCVSFGVLVFFFLKALCGADLNLFLVKCFAELDVSTAVFGLAELLNCHLVHKVKEMLR